MVRNAGELIDCIKQTVLNFGAGPKTKVTVRIGDFGPEHDVEHIKVRAGRDGPEVVIQAAKVPNLQ
jgi:hypothetical protein